VNLIGLGDQNDAARIPIEPMYDAGPRFAANGTELIKMPGKGAREGTRPMPTRRMHDHRRRFVHRDQMLVLVQDIEGDVFGIGARGAQRKHVDDDALSGLEPIGDLRSGVIHPHAAGPDHFPPLHAAVLRQLPGEIGVQTQPCIA
jgi:hypothetical protein